MKITLEDLLKISFSFKNLAKLYLFTNRINERDIVDPYLFDENFENYYSKLEYLCVDNNKICSLAKFLKILKAKSIQFLNVNQNITEDIYNDDDDEEIIKSLEY